MKVQIKNILNQFNKDIPFLQPLYETIVNSLEANATEIIVEFQRSEVFMVDNEPIGAKITGFTISDNGDGFNQNNRESFTEYLSDNKKDLGCKGIGRFTWLKVFDDIKIESFTDNEFVSFIFNKDFEDDTIQVQPIENENKRTIISFANVTSDYIKYSKKNKPIIDKRFPAELDEIKKNIEDHLLVKLFLLLQEKKASFKIELKLNNKIVVINNESIPKLDSISFDMQDPLSNNPVPQFYTFNLYYDFIDNQKNQHNLFYCADGRTVKEFSKNLKFDNLSDDASVIMLLTSKYFDERINNERNKFTFDTANNNPTLDNPIPLPKTNERLKQEMSKIIFKRYPDLDEDNKKIVDECIEEYPYLAKYIRAGDSSLIETKENIIQKANKQFETEKEKVKNDFSKMLKSKNIDEKEFLKNASKVNELSARELAQYFLYREQIINGLKKIHQEKNTCEADLHNLFMKMGDVSIKNDDSFSKYDTNIWLLDDKYMSYTGIYSDKSIKKIKDSILENSPKTDGEKKEPDLTIFYNQITNNLKDIVIVEFKALDINEIRKGAAIFEINRNIRFTAQAFDDIRTVYGYIITKIDDEFCNSMKGQPGVRTLFSNGNSPLYYIYNDNLEDKNGNKIDGHIYIMSSETVCFDAESRNKTFLDIIRSL